jgi:hypothetical protein
MIKFESLQELEKFKDLSMMCVCGKLMTGLHMNSCSKLKKEELRLKEATKDDIHTR